jgi:hypothetical protein
LRDNGIAEVCDFKVGEVSVEPLNGGQVAKVKVTADGKSLKLRVVDGKPIE